MTAPTVIVMGSEDKGIYEANLRICSHQVRIPMYGVIESLNVSVAAGVMLYRKGIVADSAMNAFASDDGSKKYLDSLKRTLGK